MNHVTWSHGPLEFKDESVGDEMKGNAWGSIIKFFPTPLGHCIFLLSGFSLHVLSCHFGKALLTIAITMSNTFE